MRRHLSNAALLVVTAIVSSQSMAEINVCVEHGLKVIRSEPCQNRGRLIATYQSTNPRPSMATSLSTARPINTQPYQIPQSTARQPSRILPALDYQPSPNHRPGDHGIGEPEPTPSTQVRAIVIDDTVPIAVNRNTGNRHNHTAESAPQNLHGGMIAGGQLSGSIMPG